MTQPTLPQLLTLAVQHHQAGRLQPAELLYRQILAQQPNNPEALHLLGVIAFQFGKNDAALELIQKSLTLNPNQPQAHSNLGNVFRDQGNLPAAITAYLQALAFHPQSAQTHYNLGTAYYQTHQLDSALTHLRQAIALNPNYYQAHSMLANILKDTGRLTEAIAAYRQVIALDPTNARSHSNLLNALHFHPDYSAAHIHAETTRWHQQHALPLQPLIPSHTNDPSPHRRLRIGYVSPDFRDHVIGRNLLPIIIQHQAQHFEIFCYSQTPAPSEDALTEKFRLAAPQWRNLSSLTDSQAAELIRHDQIDILVDLTLHLAQNRLLLFARKPAPLQITFAGYPGTTGLTAIDYRISDPYLDPPSLSGSCYSEKTLHLPHTFWCYDPLECHDLPVNPLPALTEKHLTFGCLNNFCKISPPTLRLWAKVLQAIPHSRLLLLAPEGSHRQQTQDFLAQENLAPERLEFAPLQPRRAYLELYHRIDLGLDTLPYNGHTTSLDSLWMGVPVITLVGSTVVGRAGLSQLTNLRLPELIAHTPDQFIQIACALAQDLPRLAHLRATLRAQMEQSPLMDAPTFTRHLETLYRQIWQQWCEKSPSPL